MAKGQLASFWQGLELLLGWRPLGKALLSMKQCSTDFWITLSALSRSTGNALSKLSLSVSSSADVVMDNRLALDFLLAEQRGVFAVINKICCTHINTTGLVEEDIKKMYDHARWLHSFGQGYPSTDSIWTAIRGMLPSATLFLPPFGPLVAIILLLIFGPCLFNLLVKFVSSRLQQFHIKMMVVQGF